MQNISDKIKAKIKYLVKIVKDFFVNKDTRTLTDKGKGVLCLMLFICMSAIMVALVVSSNGKAKPDGKDAEDAEIAEGSEINDEIISIEPYDKDAVIIDTEKYTETILAETEDAGEEYINETLFLGDSNSVRYMNYKFTTLDNTLAVVGMGIQSVTTMKCVKFEGLTSMVTMPEAVKIMQPRRIIINFGTNNATGMSTEDFIKKYSEALDEIHEAYEYADIIIGAIPPFAKDTKYKSISMTAIDSFNSALVNLAEEKGYKFINSSEVMKDANTGYIKDGYTVNDGIHISEAGLKALFNYIRTHSYIVEDKRPMPLNAVPKHTETVGAVKSNGQVNTDLSAAMDMSDIGVTSVPVDNGIKDIDKYINSSSGENTGVDLPSQNPSQSNTDNATSNTQVDSANTQTHQHSFGSWHNDGGSHSRSCSCGEKESQGHSFNGGSVTKPATETEDGVKTYTCSVCGATKTEKISATGKKDSEPSEENKPPKAEPTVQPDVQPQPAPEPEPENNMPSEPENEPAPEPENKPEPEPEQEPPKEEQKEQEKEQNEEPEKEKEKEPQEEQQS